MVVIVVFVVGSSGSVTALIVLEILVAVVVVRVEAIASQLVFILGSSTIHLLLVVFR